MKSNYPVTQTETPFLKGKYLVSKTDLKGVITYVNDAFVEISGYSRAELIGKSHNTVRHPDMPPQAFEDLWRTAKQGSPWRGLVKNRCKNGDYYWVDAFVVPVRKHDKIVGYMSVRTEPTRQQVAQAGARYQRLNRTKEKLDSGGGRLSRLTIKARLAMVMGFMALLMIGGGALGLGGIALDNQALESSYRDQLEPTDMIARIMQLMGDNRAQTMLALQHNPQNSLSALHNHPVMRHRDTIVKNRNEITAIWARYRQRRLSVAEKRLADRYAAIRVRYEKAMQAAISAGDHETGEAILLQKVNPLYQAARGEANAILQWTLRAAKADYEKSVARYQTIRNLMLAGTLIGLLLATAAAVFLVRSIVAPLNSAIGHFDRIAQGNLTDDIDITRPGETGRVLSGIAAMQVHLKVMLEEISAAAETIKARSALLLDKVADVVNQSERQHDNVQEITSSMEEVSQSVNEVADSADRVAAAAGDSRIIVEDSSGSMDSSMQAVSRVVSAVQGASATIGRLDQAIQKIGDVTQVIKEIADQTNLLALNAAIEAARAGETGRGFAVVADEVRKLAERTTASTVNIADMIDGIQSATEQTVASMGQAMTEVEQGIGLMKQSTASMAQITASSRELNDRAQHIAAAAKHQAAATEDVAGSMENISQLIEHNTSAAQEARESAQALAGTAKELNALVDGFELTPVNGP
ncbi:MAG TPA: hypothetical protein DEP05_00005 [Betaproteobacteria bacterium]|nr:hypothetical protein [Betaproteobacteria bacterium]